MVNVYFIDDEIDTGWWWEMTKEKGNLVGNLIVDNGNLVGPFPTKEEAIAHSINPLTYPPHFGR